MISAARHIARALTLTTWALMLASASACAHYGWADRPAHEGDPALDSRPVDITTIFVPAHEGVDAGALTHAIVDGLRREGLSLAAWNDGRPQAVAVRCSVGAIDALGFGEHMRVEADVTCELASPRTSSGQPAWTRTFSARGSTSATAPLSPSPAAIMVDTGTRLRELAILDALYRLTPLMANTIHDAHAGLE